MGLTELIAICVKFSKFVRQKYLFKKKYISLVKYHSMHEFI